MGARLTFADYCEADWGPVELTDDIQAYRTFWAAVIQYATADGGSTVHYRLDGGDDCLAIEIGGAICPMQPPPKEYRRELLLAAKRLASGSWIRRLFSLMHRTIQLGSINLETPWGAVTWHVHRVHSGLCMTRAA